MTVSSSDTPITQFFYCLGCGTRFAATSETTSQQACDCNPCTVTMSPDICGDCGKELEPGTVHFGCGTKGDR